MSPDETRLVQDSKSPGVIDARTRLYLLTLEVPQLPVDDQVYLNAWLALLRTGESAHWYDFGSLMLDYAPGMEREHGALFLMQDCFTGEELESVRAYFERHPWPGATLLLEPVCVPVPWHTLLTQLVHRPGPWIRCPFDQEPYFDCPVAFEGYFNPAWPHRMRAALNTGRQRTKGGHA